MSGVSNSVRKATVVGSRTLLAKTCRCCGEFKKADDFPLTKKKYRDSFCRGCHVQKSVPSMIQAHQTSLDGARKHRDPWTEGEVRLMEKMTSEGFSVPQMARILQRSTHAVYTKRNNLKKEQ